MTQASELVPGATGTFTVAFKVDDSGQVVIGCKEFVPDDIIEVAENLNVKPPADRPNVEKDAQGTIYTGIDRDNKVRHFVVGRTTTGWGGGNTLWDLVEKMHGNVEAWETLSSQRISRWKKVYTHGQAGLSNR
jgi:hypothetical protein